MKELTRLKLFNTESRALEEISASDGLTIKLYTCGPTVYNFAHIGNFRTYVFEDLLKRALKFFGMQVAHVMNVTDIDDKTIKGALEKKMPIREFTDTYIKAFFEDIKILNIEPADHYPRATDFIPEMIAIIQGLLDKGIAYRGEDKSIYFSIKRFPFYGRLSHLHLDELQEGASERIIHDEYEKEHASDFVLWKAYDDQRDGNIFWESPFGKGRPGWHIECSAMAMTLLGESIDIHAGGVDNIFPHHENEIAQSEGYTSKCFVRHWVHCEHLLVNHKKMSKSLGNFYTLRDLLERGFTGQQVRYMLLQTHYRTQLNFTLEGLEAAGHSLERLGDFILRLQEISDPKTYHLTAPIVQKTFDLFSKGLADDLNISQSLAALFDMVREINVLCDREEIGKSEAKNVLDVLEQFDPVLGMLPLKPEEVSIPKELEEALQNRIKARAEKKWDMADEFRDFIHSKGYMIEDTPSGARLKKVRTTT